MRQFNVGLGDLVDFLQKQGVDIEENPNAKVSEDLMPAIAKAFGKDLEAKQAAEQVDIKISEILERSGKKAKAEAEEEEIEEVVRIKTNTFINDKKETPKPEPKPEPVAEPVPEAPAVPAGIAVRDATQTSLTFQWALVPDAETPDSVLGVSDRAKTVYAVWKKMFTVTFDANKGTFPDESTEKSKVVADGAAIDVEGFDVPQTYTSEEEIKYYFSGWALEADAETALETLGSATDNVTLYAVWTEAPTFTVTYDTRGFGVSVDYVQEGEKTTLPETPKADGYKFVGWLTDSTFAEGSEFDPETPIVENVVAYAKWNIVEYEIVYIMGKGANNEENPVSYTVETPTIKLQPPTKKGYHFDGWYYDADFVNTATQITEGSTGKVKLYAKWEIKTFTVTYMAGEFALEIVKPDVANIRLQVRTDGDTVWLKETSFTRYGYLQDGWSTKDGGKKKYDLGAEYAADADVTLFPHWVKDPTAIPTVAKVAPASFTAVAHARTLEISGARLGADVTVYDMRGKAVAKATANAASFSMGTFVPGMYLVRVGSDAQRVLVR